MADADDLVELLFFDTFSHEIHEDINLDLVQFPKPVYITEIRIIPLGARVQADFPGGVRLGATNPSKFGIQFFVNDLSKPGASTFEILGNLEYNQNDCIHLECQNDKIPTDGLVLRGWYTTITLAVYGTLTNNIAEQIDSPPPPVEVVPEEVTAVPVEITAAEPLIPEPQTNIPEDVIPQPAPEIFEREVFPEPQFERNFEQPPYPEDAYYQTSSQDGIREHEPKRVSRRKSLSSERSNSRHRTYSRSDSNDRDYPSRQKREWSRSPEYRHSRRIRRDRSRDIPEHSEREHKWPRTPPSQHVSSPRRPRSPETVDHFSDIGDDSDYKYRQKSKAGLQPSRPIDDDSAATTPTPAEAPEEIQELAPIDEDTMSQGEQFEPILSDDEIVGDDDNTNEEQENEEMDVEEEFEDIIKVYDPFKTPLARFEFDMLPSCAREIEIFDKLLTKYELQTKTATTDDFLKSSNDEKENFVYISEQLLTHLTQINLSSFDRRNFILKSVFQARKDRLKLATNILKIALSFECACDQPQPGFKVRHIKIGARLAECFGSSEDFITHYIKVEKCDPFNDLFHLYEQQYMALSIKLLILRAIYANLDTKLGVTTFLNNKLNGYQRILSLLQSNPLTRAKFALTSIVKKIHLYEAVESVHDVVTKQFVLAKSDVETPYETLECCFKEVKRALVSETMNYQQPKRFLPVSEKFEIVKDANSINSWSHMMRSYLKIHAFAETLLLILSNQSFVPPTLVDMTLEMLKMLAHSPIGIDYLVQDAFETLQIMVKYLLNIENYSMEEGGEEKKVADEEGVIKEKSKHITRDFDRLQKLGIEISFRIQTHYHMSAIANTKDDTDALIEHLHALYSQTCYTPGRTYTVEALTSIHNNIEPLLHLIEKERKCQAQRNPDSPALKYKSPVLSYSVDLIDCCIRHSNDVRFLGEHESILVDLAKHHEVFESSVSAVLQEMAVFLKPLETGNSFSYDDVSPLCEVIKRSLEYITTFPGDLIMALRILKHLGIADQNIDFEKQTKELKHRYVILQFYSADGVVTIVNILEKLNTYFEQPGLHCATLMTSQAVHACQILLPALKILREMLTFVIQCRDAQFKDVTAIEHLLKTYALMHYYPEMSQAYEEAQNIKAEIIKILLAYTQPNPQDQESVHKSLWTQMIREVIKFILTTPSTFIPGLQVFAELLPLPLPVQTVYAPSEMESVAARLITERKLWSAHLHPQSSLITELIQTICPSSFPQLIDLLTRVCLQLADLAPNMTLLVSKTVTDLILNETSSVGSSGSARLLKFLAQLTAYASVKISSLSILSGRLYDYLNQVLTNPDKSEQHIQCQIHVHRIYENFFDSEISMIAPNTSENAQLNLASALPSRDLFPGIINAILVNLLNSELTSEVVIAACRNLIILTEHDITCYHLKAALEAKRQEVQDWLKTIVDAEELSIHRSLAGTIVLLIRALMFIDESGPDTYIPSRTIKLTVNELASIIGWTSEAATTHPLTKLKEQFSINGSDNPNSAYLLDLNMILTLFEKFDASADTDKKQDIPEPNLPQAEGIITQYLSRPIFTPYEPTDESQLIANYWLEPIRLDTLPENIISQAERIPCDLNEIVKCCLPPETNLPSDCKRVLHLSASPQSSRERTTTAPCFRTRRVEVEPSTGRPEKKIFVTPMRGRGFPRTPPSRGDLFRSRPPNTSRPPSLHVDDFLALETCGAQPTGPTGYNKISREIINIRGSRVGRNRGSRIPPISSSGSYRTGSPSTWSHESSVAPPQHFRTATSEPVVSSHFASESHYSQPHFGGAPIRSRGRGRPRTFIR